VTNQSLAESYLVKARTRLKILPVLLADDAHSDVIREAQEIVELALKGMLRQAGIEPPRWYDVGDVLKEYRDRFTPGVSSEIDRLADISAWLRKEREFSFYGDIDFIPTERYSRQDADRAIADARFVVSITEAAIPPRQPGG
jgi:HEPN domain-containing protein